MLAVMVAEILRAGRREHGVGKIAAGARRRGRAVEQGRTPRRADPAFARNRLVDDSDQRPAVLQERDQRAEDRAARHEADRRSEEHTSELQSLMRISYAVFCLKKKKKQQNKQRTKDRDR